MKKTSLILLFKPAKNHYFGNISRIGRALAETRYAQQVEDLLFKMVQYPQLDDFNRYLCFYLFSNYVKIILIPKTIYSNDVSTYRVA
jgi:hypothetical protein